MKKTALTIGLFSLVMVATSFAAPTTASLYGNNDTETDGTPATGGTQKKRDFHAGNIQVASTQSSVNQSLGGNKKID